ncbi:hypothetical protein Rsub_09533 [Raphidocelis subcapitata]|uniref:Enhancer of polycomb-like protein n=1 Tax=Raphidocelis subcapitata TaxID=307507 RepID=A0A2V0PGM3_9CHLO|nr:hypothetical protein Rsub_09533 [Raphidocelis subcapitata]|eukprot:GBF97060.1 hypothetical protein Rsub_09533 [Raphidocelis subcapitata]
MGTRTSFRPRPVDANKPLLIVRDLSELDTQDGNGEKPELKPLGQPKKPQKEIPTPEVHFVETYHRDYLPVFVANQHYAHGKGGSGYRDDAVVEYDLDNEDEDWLEAYNTGGAKLSDTKFERMLWKLELACAEATEDALMRAGASVAERTSATALAAIDHLGKDLALGVLLEVGARDVIANDVYEYWAAKRRRWGKPILRRLQAPTSASDTNPFNVFRPREKVNRPQTRRRRDNPEECMEKLRSMQDNVRAALGIVCEIIRRERRKRDLTHTEVELQRIRVRQRHDPRTNGSLEDAAQFGMAQLKARNSKNRELDVLRAGGRLLANGVRIEPTVRPSKRQRRPELLPYLRQEVARLAPPPPPPASEEMAFAWPISLPKLLEQHSQRLWRAAVDARESAARRALAANAEPPPPLGPAKEVLAGAPPALRVPEGAAVAGSSRLRLGRGGRVVLDRVDAWSLEPLAAASQEERAFRQYLSEPWPQLPKGGVLRGLVDRVCPPPRVNPAAAAAAAQQAAMARQGSASGGGAAVAAAAAAAAAQAASGSRMGSQGSIGPGNPLARLPSGGAAAAAAGAAQQAAALTGAPSLAGAASLPAGGLQGGGGGGGGGGAEPVQASTAGAARPASVATPPPAAAAAGGSGGGAGDESPTAAAGGAAVAARRTPAVKSEGRGTPGASGGGTPTAQAGTPSQGGPPPKRSAARPPKG